jgi:uncharacterized protein YjiS (DUF1127 family)
MSTKPAGEVFRTAPPEISPVELRPLPRAELARIVRRAELMRAAYVARLLRFAGRGLARLGRAAWATLPPAACPLPGTARTPARPCPNPHCRSPDPTAHRKASAMINLAFTLIPSSIPSADSQDRAVPPPEAKEGFLGALARWVRARVRYRRALHALRRLDDRDLDDLGLGRVDFPELAWRHATGAAPLTRPLG